jgi:hypothetical protein
VSQTLSPNASFVPDISASCASKEDHASLPRWMIGKSKEHVFKYTSNVHRLAQNDGHRLSYIFIAYTSEQFNTPDDFRVLHEIADVAARNAGVIAYWVGCSCMPGNQLEEDVNILFI